MPLGHLHRENCLKSPRNLPIKGLKVLQFWRTRRRCLKGSYRYTEDIKEMY